MVFASSCPPSICSTCAASSGVSAIICKASAKICETDAWKEPTAVVMPSAESGMPASIRFPRIRSTKAPTSVPVTVPIETMRESLFLKLTASASAPRAGSRESRESMRFCVKSKESPNAAGAAMEKGRNAAPLASANRAAPETIAQSRAANSAQSQGLIRKETARPMTLQVRKSGLLQSVSAKVAQIARTPKEMAEGIFSPAPEVGSMRFI